MVESPLCTACKLFHTLADLADLSVVGSGLVRETGSLRMEAPVWLRLLVLLDCRALEMSETTISKTPRLPIRILSWRVVVVNQANSRSQPGRINRTT